MTGTRVPVEAIDGLEEIVRRIAREEIASLAGLVVRRTQESSAVFRSGERVSVSYVVANRLASIFGEALNDFSTETEPGS